MENYSDVAQVLALAAGLACAYGINAYAVVLLLGLLGRFGNVDLPPGMATLENPLVMGAALTMYLVEFVADKIPGVDSLWDVLQTFVRIPAGAALAAAAAAQISPDIAVATGAAGAALATATHAAKAGSRLLINTSPEPFSNWAASLGEDAAVIGGLWLALCHPWIFTGFAALLALLLAWLLPRIWRGVRLLSGRIARLFQGRARPSPSPARD